MCLFDPKISTIHTFTVYSERHLLCHVFSLWRHSMETLYALQAFCVGILLVDFSHKRAVIRSFDSFFVFIDAFETPWRSYDVTAWRSKVTKQFLSDVWEMLSPTAALLDKDMCVACKMMWTGVHGYGVHKYYHMGGFQCQAWYMDFSGYCLGKNICNSTSFISHDWQLTWIWRGKKSLSELMTDIAYALLYPSL